MILWILWQANGHLVFTVAKNVVGDNRVRLTPDNLETNLFLNYNLNYDMDSLESESEDSEIEFSEDSDDNDLMTIE